MKNVLITLFVLLILLSCVRNNSEKISPISLNQKKMSKDSVIDKEQIYDGDTLFSIFTSNLEDSLIENEYKKIKEVNPNFVYEYRTPSYYGHLDGSPKSDTHWNQKCYRITLNGKAYSFDVGFDENPSDAFSTETSALTNKLDFIILYYRSKKNILREDILNLYKRKYGDFIRQSKIKKEYGSPFLPNSENKLVYETTNDTYTWKSRPTLKIEFISYHNIEKPFFGEPNTYNYEIQIFYYSKRFLKNLSKITSIKNQQIRDETRKKSEYLKKDI